MNMLLNLLAATGLIVVLILFRLFAERKVLQARIQRSHTDTGCEQSGCLRGCDLDRTAIEADSGFGNNASNRRPNHAP